jgi:hypothetical protein
VVAYEEEFEVEGEAKDEKMVGGNVRTTLVV